MYREKKLDGWSKSILNGKIDYPLVSRNKNSIFEARSLQLKIKFQKQFLNNWSPIAVFSSTYKMQIKRNL